MTSVYQLAPSPNWQEWQEVTIDSNPPEFTFSADTVGNAITILGSLPSNYFTGKAVKFSSTATLPSPLSASYTYYLIFLTSTTFKVASSYVNAIANTAVTLTTSGTGVLTVQAAAQVYLQPLANGKIYTYSSLSHVTNKATYTDWTGNTENPNPIILNNKGQAVIYWKVNESDNTDNYYIEVYDENDVLIYARDNFNANFAGSTPTSDTQAINFCRNYMFSYWGLYDYNNVDVVCPLLQTDQETAYEWFFAKNNTNATDALTRNTFAPGQVDVPDNPVYYATYACTNVGAGGETFKYFYQKYENAQTFSGESITFSIYLSSSFGTTPTISIDALQYFGSGGSTSVSVTGQSFVISNVWDQYTVTLSVPSVAAKTIGAGSYFAIRLNVPLNSTATINMVRTIGNIGTTINENSQLTLEEQKNTLTIVGETSEIKVFPNVSMAPRTWIPLAGTIGNFNSSSATYHNVMCKSLYLYLWDTFDNVSCPVYTAAGAPTVRGATALADFNAGVGIALWFNSGRVISNTGTPNFSIPFTVTTSSTTLTVVDPNGYVPHNFYDGTEVRVTTTGTLPDPLLINTSYFIGVKSPTTYGLASTRQNALDGTFIANFTTAGTGIQTISLYNDYALANGQMLGEQSHTQTMNELSRHNHGLDVKFTANNIQVDGYSSGNNANAIDIPYQGTSTPMNIMQPTLGLPYIIKL